MKSIVSESDNRQSKMMFKLAVELAMLMNVVAASSEIDVNFRFEDAVEWQS